MNLSEKEEHWFTSDALSHLPLRLIPRTNSTFAIFAEEQNYKGKSLIMDQYVCVAQA